MIRGLIYYYWLKAKGFTVLSLLVLLASLSWGQTTETKTYTTSGTFTVPYGVTSITVECWGGGGGGASTAEPGFLSAPNYGNGGGGGAYASSIIPTVYGNVYSFTIGDGGGAKSNGTATSFGGLVVASGGSGADYGGAGGSLASSKGDIKVAGGDGGVPGGSLSGAGGNAGNYSIALSSGAGGLGVGTSTNGNNGKDYGGGGSGSASARGWGDNNKTGGAGANGYVVVTYTLPYTTWYYISGNANRAASWKSNADGSGTSPANFTGNNQAYVIPEGKAATLNGALTIGGNNSVLYLANGATLTLGGNTLTLDVDARIENAGNGMVVTNGTGNLVKRGATSSSFAMLYPVGTAGSYAPVRIGSFAATTIGANAAVRIRSVAAAPAGIAGTKINRYWITSTVGFSGSVLADIDFTYHANDLGTAPADQLDLFYSSNGGTTWAYPNGISRTGVVPLRASAATTLDAQWTASVSDKKIWYSLASGSWDDPNTWTLDPSGAQPNNPNGLTPATSPTALSDEVVVLSGRLVTVPTGNKKNARLTVLGSLDFGTTAGNAFNNIDGSGRILLAGDNFPDGNAYNFITKGAGEGTVEYYGATRVLSTPRTFYNVIVNLAAGNELTLLSNYSINGDFTVQQGHFKINSNTSTSPLAITVSGNMLVEAAGKILTGSANARHQLNLYGNFTNRGDVRFTNRTTPNYTAEATDGIVDVNFLNTAANQAVLCRGITNFYRVEVDKGLDKTYVLSIDASASANFKLLGYANENHGSIAQLTANNNALGLIRGTVRLGNSLVIPTLTVAGNYVVSENAQLIVSGAALTQNNGTTLSVYGTLKSESGTTEVKNGNGIVLCGNGTLNVEGGDVTLNQLRVADGAGHNGSYVQVGGTVNVVGESVNASYFVFTLSNTSSVFNMSGGTLTVNTGRCKGGIFINSAAENVQVTGGTVIAETKSTDDFIINSSAPFWNLSLKNSSAADRSFVLGAATNVGTGNITVAGQPLRVLKDLRLWGKQSGGSTYPKVNLVTGINDVYIGGSLFVEQGAQYTPIGGGTAPYDTEATQPTTRNTTYFNKTAGTNGVGFIYNGNTTSSLELGNLVIDRTDGYEVVVATPVGRSDESIILDINGTATVSSGVLDQSRYTIRTWGAITNYGRLGKYISGTTPDRAQIRIMENASLTLTTSPSAVFGNVRIDVAPTRRLTLTGDTYIERLEYVRGLVYLKNYILKVDYLWGMNRGLFENVSSDSKLAVANTGYSGESMIFTDGDAGDGGLKLMVSGNTQAENESSRLNNQGPITYPLGFTTNGGTTLYFRPAQMMVKGYSDDGYVTIRPVSGYLQTTQNSGKVLQHYWRVTHEGFTTRPTVAYRFYYRNNNSNANNNIVDLFSTSPAQERRFLGGAVLDESPYTRSYENTDDINQNTDTRTITINGSSTGGLFSSAAAGVPLANANYTAGEQPRFEGSVLIYYTRDYGEQTANETSTSSGANKEPRWTDSRTWTRSDMLNPAFDPHDSRQPQVPAGSYPGAGDVAQIGWVPWNDINKDGNAGNGGGGRDTRNILGYPHGVWITTPITVAEVVFTQMTDDTPERKPVARKYRSNFQFRPTLCINGSGDNGALKAKLVKGEGLFWNRESDPDFTQMDIGDFARQDSSYVIYENFTNNRIISNSASLFPNLYLANNDWGRNDYNFTFSRNVETTGNLELLGSMDLVLPTGATGNITVGRHLKMFAEGIATDGAELRFGNTGTPRKVVVKGDLRMENQNAFVSVAAGTTVVDHQLVVAGNIIQGNADYAANGLQLYNTPGNNRARVTLVLDGSGNMVYNRGNVGGNNSSLYRLVVNKGTSAATTATFNTDFTLNGPTAGVGVTKALELQAGTFIYNPTSDANQVVLSSGNDYFSIPAAAGLTIQKGIMKVSGNSGIQLDGKLTLLGGLLDMDDEENHIEYSASGNSAITIAGGATLAVGGQISRSTTSNEGILKYSQAGGNVTVGVQGASKNNRGVFEILNAGSAFTMTNGTLTVARAQNNPTISAFYFDPETYSITSSTIIIGNDATSATGKIGLYANKPLPSLQIYKGVATLDVVPATITQLLDIKPGATFDANGLNLTLKGDFTAMGTYVPNRNTTFFSGSTTQTVTGNGSTLTFYSLDKTAANTLNLSGSSAPLLVENELLMRGGTLAAGANNITAKGNVLNSGRFTCDAGLTYGVLLNGGLRQSLSGNGTFDKLTIQNLNGIDIPVGNNLTVNASLKMMGGVLNVGQNYFDLGVNATIEEATAFSKTNMITTNISFSDNGVRKTFATGPTSNFIFPVGSGDKYTPVTFNISANGNSTGKIAVVPANEVHSSIVEDAETGVQIVDKDNALHYYWTLKATGIAGLSGTATMRYIDTDVKVTTPYTAADYITAQLLNDGSGQWLKYDKVDFDEANRNMVYRFSGNDDATISGDYTAGAVDNTKNGAIPDQVAKYETNHTNTWNTTTVWTPNVAGGPRGAITKINLGHTITMTENFYSEYATEILGTLKVNSTYGHRLGIASGTGTIFSEAGSIPAAVYDRFFAADGGTLEFSGTGSYEFLGNILTVNNLTLSGSGTKNLPNNNLTLNGNLLIDGSTSLQTLNSHNKTLTVNGNITRKQGTFDAGTGADASVVLAGSRIQTISGTFTDANAFNNLQINKTAGDVDIANNVEIDRQLVLTKGIFDVAPGNTFKLNYGATVSGGSLASFVTGELTAELMNGNSFTYPVGDISTQVSYGQIALKNVSGPSGINEWKSRYYFRQAPCDVTSFQAPIASVSKSEYWTFSAPTGGQAYIAITLSGTNDAANGVADLNNLRVIGFNTTTNKWEVVGSGATVTGTKTAGMITTTARVNFGSYSCFTLGAVTPLDAGSAWFASGATVDLCEGSTTLKVGFSGFAPWEFTYSRTVNGGTPTVSTVTTSDNPYLMEVTPAVGTVVYELLGMKSKDNATGVSIPGIITAGKNKVTISVSGKPTVALSANATTICEGGSVTFTATAGLNSYQFRVNNVVVQTGAANTYTSASLPSGSVSVDVIGTTAAGCSNTSSAATVTVNPKPVAAGAISGKASVCRNSTETYSIPAIDNATSYVWSVTGGGASIAAGQGTASISIRFTTAGSATLTVMGSNACGNGVASTMTVAVNTSATAGDAGVITGPADICKGSTYTFSVADVPNATSYVWSYNGAGATITGSGKEVTVIFSEAATSGNLTVYGTNGCKDGGVSPAKPITANTPPVVSFDNANPSGCEGGTIPLSGKVTGGSGTYTYTWSGSRVGALDNAGIANPKFGIDNAFGDFNLTLRATDSKGCYGEQPITVRVFERPRVSAGPDALDICSGMDPIAMTGATATGSYTGTPTWSVNPAAVGSMTNSTNPAFASFTPSSLYGDATLTLTLTGSNGCSNVSDSRQIKWSGAPLQPSAISGSTSVCSGGATVTYTVTDDAFVDTYTWTYDGTGATLTPARNSVTIAFAAGATSGKLSVVGSSPCGASPARTLDIAVLPAPATPIITVRSACAGDAIPLGIDNAAAGNTYIWSVTSLGFSIVTSGANSELVTPSNDDLFPVGSPDLLFFPDVKVVVTNASGCTSEVVNTNLNSYLKVLRIPRTGPPYHLQNNMAK